MGMVPELWRRGRVVLIPKPVAGYRPLTILSCAWRVGARLLVGQLAEWIDSWASHRVLGGVHSRGVRDSFLRILDSFDTDQLYVQEDLTKFFDGIRHADLQASLAQLGAPRALCALLRDFQRGHSRVFTHNGGYGSSWHHVRCGVPQGCPLSPMLAGVVMALWSQHVEAGGGGAVQTASFVDDRLVWASAPSVLAGAMSRSSGFDSAYGFTCDVAKCRFVGRAPSPEARALAASLGYEEATLGLVIPLDRAEAPTLRGFDLEKARRRIRLIAVAVQGLPAKRRFLSMLVLPMVTWAGGYGTIPARDLKALIASDGLGAASWLRQGPGGSSVCCWSSVPRPGLGGRGFGAVGRQALACPEDLGWWCDLRGYFVHRRDSYGQVRSFEVGVDSLEVVTSWLRDVYRRRGLQRSPLGLAQCYGHLGAAVGFGDWLLRVQAPANRLQERLLAYEVPEVPGPPRAVDPDDLLEALAEALEVKLAAGGPVFVATDGSLVDTVAAWAVALDGDLAFSQTVTGEDQSAHRAEVDGAQNLEELSGRMITSSVPWRRAVATGLRCLDTGQGVAKHHAGEPPTGRLWVSFLVCLDYPILSIDMAWQVGLSLCSRCQPGLAVDHSPYLGVRIGEASHPGPSGGGSRATARRRQEHDDDDSLLQNVGRGGLAAMLRPMIETLLRELIQELLGGGALQGLLAGVLAGEHPSTSSRPPRAAPTDFVAEPAKGRGMKRWGMQPGGSRAVDLEADDGPGGQGQDETAGSGPAKGKGKTRDGGDGAAKGSTADGKGKSREGGDGSAKGKGADGKGNSRDGGDGSAKGKGANGKGKSRDGGDGSYQGKAAGDEADGGEWTVVGRRLGDWALRAGDWSDPVLSYDELVAKASGGDAPVRAVALVSEEQRDVLTSLFRGAAKQHALLLVEQRSGERTERCPGSCGGRLAFRQVFFTRARPVASWKC
eukprot:s5284_g6.t1